MNPVHSITVQYQFDTDTPMMGTTVSYQVSELSTEIQFPNGTRTFDNWDVKGCRERHYREEYVLQGVAASDEQAVVTDGTLGKEPKDFGVTATDVRCFVANLARKHQYEDLFDGILWTEETPPRVILVPEVRVVPAPVPAPQVVKEKEAVAAEPKRAGCRKFPYMEVARLWHEGKTLREIAAAIDYLDDGKDVTHTVRTFLTKMHDENKGYIDENGQKLVLPYRDRSRRGMKAAVASA